jgi:hypothetical protein
VSELEIPIISIVGWAIKNPIATESIVLLAVRESNSAGYITLQIVGDLNFETALCINCGMTSAASRERSMAWISAVLSIAI